MKRWVYKVLGTLTCNYWYNEILATLNNHISRHAASHLPTEKLLSTPASFWKGHPHPFSVKPWNRSIDLQYSWQVAERGLFLREDGLLPDALKEWPAAACHLAFTEGYNTIFTWRWVDCKSKSQNSALIFLPAWFLVSTLQHVFVSCSLLKIFI